MISHVEYIYATVPSPKTNEITNTAIHTVQITYFIALCCRLLLTWANIPNPGRAKIATKTLPNTDRTSMDK